MKLNVEKLKALPETIRPFYSEEDKLISIDLKNGFSLIANERFDYECYINYYLDDLEDLTTGFVDDGTKLSELTKILNLDIFD